MILTSFTWFDLIPVVGIVVTIVGISLKAGRELQKLDNVIEDIKKIEQNEYGVRLTI